MPRYIYTLSENDNFISQFQDRKPRLGLSPISLLKLSRFPHHNKSGSHDIHVS